MPIADESAGTGKMKKTKVVMVVGEYREEMCLIAISAEIWSQRRNMLLSQKEGFYSPEKWIY
jgi:hypothetical protein